MEGLIKDTKKTLLSSLKSIRDNTQALLDEAERAIIDWTEAETGTLKKSSEIYTDNVSQIDVKSPGAKLKELARQYFTCLKIKQNTEAHLDRQMDKILEESPVKTSVLEQV